jgi:threonine/homoserine/homoserine lactone efflux protein
MGQQEFVAFFIFSLTAAATPGPSNLLVMNAGMRAGVAGGLPCLAGVVGGMGLLMGAAVAGLGGLLSAQPGLLGLLRWTGAIVLLWLAWKIATSPPLGTAAHGDPVGFWKALVFQWVNPKSWVVAASAAASYGASEQVPVALRAAALAGTFMLAACPSVALWLVFGAVLQRWMSDPGKARLIFVGMGLALAASVVLVLR